MRLANMLKQPGGVSEQGRRWCCACHAGPCRRSHGARPDRRDAALRVEREAAERLARETAAKPDAVLPEASEAVIRCCQASLRDQGT